MKTAYLVVSDTSTRASADPGSPDFGRWLHYAAGATVADWPDHAPVAEWAASGHWQPAQPAARKAKEPK